MIRTDVQRPALRVLSRGGGPPSAPNPLEGRYIIMAGNLTEGFEAWGTFDSFEMAAQYAIQHLYDKETWIMTLEEKKSKPS